MSKTSVSMGIATAPHRAAASATGTAAGIITGNAVGMATGAMDRAAAELTPTAARDTASETGRPEIRARRVADEPRRAPPRPANNGRESAARRGADGDSPRVRDVY